MKFSQFNFLTKTEDKNVLICNTLTGAVIVLPLDKFEIIKTNFVVNSTDAGNEKFEQDIITFCENLKKGGFLVGNDDDEIIKLNYLSNYARYKGDYLDLRLLPTEQCNCRCVYCYESFEKGEMSDEIRNRVKLLLDKKTPGLKRLNLGWFGGEPLLAINTIEDLTKKIFELKEKHNFSYESHLTTNGTLLNQEMLRRLLSCSIKRIQITMDGYEIEQDKRKKFVDGTGTFNCVINNLNLIRDISEEYYLSFRINYDKGNFDSIPQLVDKLNEILKDKVKFSVFFRPTGNWGGNKEVENFELIKGNEKYFQARLEKYLKANSLSNDNLNIPILNNSTCYATFPHCYTIGSDGTIYKCTVYFSEEKNKVGFLDECGDLKIDILKMSSWINDGIYDEKCIKCFLLPSCLNKGCPASKVLNFKQKCPRIKYEIKNNLINIYCNYKKNSNQIINENINK